MLNANILKNITYFLEYNPLDIKMYNSKILNLQLDNIRL